jgi:hypothetical protein
MVILLCKTIPLRENPSNLRVSASQKNLWKSVELYRLSISATLPLWLSKSY